MWNLMCPWHFQAPLGMVRVMGAAVIAHGVQMAVPEGGSWRRRGGDLEAVQSWPAGEGASISSLRRAEV